MVSPLEAPFLIHMTEKARHVVVTEPSSGPAALAIVRHLDQRINSSLIHPSAGSTIGMGKLSPYLIGR